MKKKIAILSLVFSGLLLLTVTGLLVSLFKNINSEDTRILYYIVLIFTSTFGIYYLLEGCKKGVASKFYVCFMGFMALGELVAIAYSDCYTWMGRVLIAVSIASYALLCFSKDLGQKKSYIFGGIALAARIITFIFILIGRGSVSMTVAASLVQTATAIFMIYAKYFDKAQRGSK